MPGGARTLPILGGQPVLDFPNTVDDPLGPAPLDLIADNPGRRSRGLDVG